MSGSMKSSIRAGILDCVSNPESYNVVLIRSVGKDAPPFCVTPFTKGSYIQ